MTAGDADLVARVLAGERDEYGELVKRHQDALYRHALGMVRSPDAAADLVQDSFVRGFTRLDTCQDPERFGAWVFRILRNLCLDYLKDRRRDVVPLDPEMPYAADGEDAHLLLEREELRRSVSRALAALPDAQREAFLMKHVEDLSYEEMAERTDASVSALKMRVMRAREALHALLAEPEGAEM
jgi:RNA polymerase sigma-70 factor (ECF subfamily)